MSDDEVFDCRACGACCRDASDGRVSVSTEDIVRWKRIGRKDIVDGLVEGHFSTMAFPSRPDGSCVHLGDGDRDNDCSIYEIRGHICHLLEPGSEQCRAYRRTDAKLMARASAPKA
jgi:Fe-S-cluster containining protein